ncbi:MAG: glycosyltransferase family 4 protein [Candidatus Humimicrobiaceae bacterium]
MKILMINSLYFPNILGGAEISVQILAEELQKNGFETVVITLSDKNYTDFVNSVKVYYISHSNVFWLLNSKRISKLSILLRHLASLKNPAIDRKLKKIIKSENPDIIHTNNLIGLSYFFWKVIRKNKIPLVHTLHDYYLLCRKSTLYSKNKNCTSICHSCRFFSVPKKFLSKDIDSIVGVTDFILKKHTDEYFFKFSKKFIISSPIKINSGIFPKQIIDMPITFAFIGLISKTKGIEKLLETFTGIGSSANILILGKAKNKDYEENLKIKFSTENISFIGFADIYEILPKIDVLVIPSLWNEPFGRVIIEAYSYGIPVIGSNRGGIPELIEDGKTGFIFEPDKNGEMEAKIKIFIDKPELILNMSKNCVYKAKKYSAEKVTAKYMELYENLLQDKL